MKLNILNMETWNRAEHYRHFIDKVRCVISLTADIDVTTLAKAMKEQDRRFYPTFIYIISHVVNNRDEFKMGYDLEGNVGIWDVVHPSYIIFHEDDESTTRIYTPWTKDYETFYKASCADLDRYENTKGFSIENVPPNIFDVSCLPWIHYKSLDLHVFDSGTYLAPVITWGKYEDDGSGKIRLPLSMQIHHAAADGFHVSRFFSEVQDLCNRLL